MNSESPVFVALGSNLGDRAANIHAAVAKLAASKGVRTGRLSPLLDNPAVGGPADSPPFLNVVLEISTTLGPSQLLARLLEIEADMGRTRRERNEPRIIDLDLLLYANLVQDAPDLILPHPRLHERRFVLQPLAKLAPYLVHPRLGKTILTLLDELAPDGVK